MNKSMIIGRLGGEPKTFYSDAGNAIANISVATTEKYNNKKTGEKEERTEWHSVVFFNRLAEVVDEYLHKGSQVYIEGRLQTRKWQDKDGSDRYTTEIVADRMEMLGSKRDGNHSQPLPPPRTEQHTDNNFDDDIPF